MTYHCSVRIRWRRSKDKRAISSHSLLVGLDLETADHLSGVSSPDSLSVHVRYGHAAISLIIRRSRSKIDLLDGRLLQDQLANQLG
jgi:hypothetical protein